MKTVIGVLSFALVGSVAVPDAFATYTCGTSGGEMVCNDQSGSSSIVVLGVRTDTNPDRVVLCEVLGGNEVTIFNAGSLQDDTRIRGLGGNEWMSVVYSGSASWCGHTYYPMDYGSNRYLIFDGGSGNDVIVQAIGGEHVLLGGDGNDDILLRDDEAGGYGDLGHDRIQSDYLYDGDYLSGGDGCDCLQDNGPSGQKTATFYCGADDDFYQPKDIGILNGCENDVTNCGSLYYQFQCFG